MLENRKIAALSEYIATLSNAGADFFGYSIPKKLQAALDECRDRSGYMSAEKVYIKLFDLNATAYAGRYKNETKPEPEPLPAIYPRIFQRREQGKDESITEWYEQIKPWHYELLKLTECFIYQCNEYPAHEQPLFEGLQALKRTQEHHIISNQPEYIKAPWG